jgi:hypothetical protein
MKKYLLTLVLCLFASPAFAAVGYTSCTYFEGAACTTCDTTVHTVGATDNYLLVFVGQDADLTEGNLTGASWDQAGTPQAMTPIANNNSVGVVVGKAFELVNPTVGNKTLRVTATTGTRCCDIVICSFTGVNTSAPSGTPVELESGGGSTTGSSLAVTIGSGGLAVDFLISQSAFTNFAAGANQDSRHATTTGCAADCQSQASTTTVSPPDYTWNSSSNAFWHVAIPINAASTRRAIPPMVFE